MGCDQVESFSDGSWGVASGSLEGVRRLERFRVFTEEKGGKSCPLRWVTNGGNIFWDVIPKPRRGLSFLRTTEGGVVFGGCSWAYKMGGRVSRFVVPQCPEEGIPTVGLKLDGLQEGDVLTR